MNGPIDPQLSTTVETTSGSDLDTSIMVETWNHGANRVSDGATRSSRNQPCTLRHAWDGYDAYLFDIDGTLLHCHDAVHYHAFCNVLTSVAGRPVTLDGIPVQGKIDPGILRDAFAHAGVPEADWLPRLPTLLQQMGDHAEAHENDFDIEVLPGVRATLEHLRQRGKLLSVGTGNLQRIGWAKLRHCGLRDFFTLGGFSDQFHHRGDMIAAAASAARTALQNPNASILVLGDTPGDIAAARFAGVDVLAIATGIYSADQLQGADLVVPSLLALEP